MAASASLLRSFSIQCRIVGALLLREAITRYGRHNIGLLWLLLEPLLYTLVIATLWHLMKLSLFSSIPVIAFAVTGFSALGLWRNTSMRCMTGVRVNTSLTYHRNVKVIDLVLSRGILEIVGSTAAFFGLTLLFAYLGMMDWPEDPLLALCGWLLLAWFGLGLGLVICAFHERFEPFERVWQALQYPVNLVSGVFFMADWLPPEAREFILLVPMVHGTEMIRHGFFGDMSTTYESPLYLIFVNLTLTLAGLILIAETGRRLAPR